MQQRQKQYDVFNKFKASQQKVFTFLKENREKSNRYFQITLLTI